jgi:hypothetical protein
VARREYSPFPGNCGYHMRQLRGLTKPLTCLCADPFGDDDSDIPVFFTVNDFFEENEKAVDDSPLFRPELD